MTQLCFLKCVSDSHEPIPLPHDVEILIGRSKVTKIINQSCSRQQISAKANCIDCTVQLKQLGVNPSGLDGFALSRNSAYTVKHGSKVEILLNEYIHVIEFEPPPKGAEKIVLNSKRKLEDANNSRIDKVIKLDSNADSKNIMAATENVWESIDKGELYIFTSKGVKSSKKIAAFDMDGTLIKTKSGKVLPVDTKDWQIASNEVSKKLKVKLADGYKIVILTNQAPIGKGRVKIEDFKKKMEAIVDKLDVPVQAFIATGKGMYRKPTTGMWKMLAEKKNNGIEIDMDESFYCGDAAARVANWAPGKKKDHSMADKLLAENLGLKFYTPEEFFLGHPRNRAPFDKPEFNPKEIISEPFNEKLISDTKEIIVLVGFPGSGKSFLAKQIESKSNKRYMSVCRDLLGTWQKCASEAKKILQGGKSVIVDSTNPDLESRGRWTSLAKEMKVDCRCAKMNTTMAHARHNNKFRELLKMNHLQVTDMVFYAYKNKYKEPSIEEGFKEIIEVQFSPSFNDRKSEELYMMHLLEK